MKSGLPSSTLALDVSPRVSGLFLKNLSDFSAIETHRNTFTETPETTVALCRGYRTATKKTLPLRLDRSHFAVVRHLARDAFWGNLKEPAELLAAATQFHLRPFNGHRCRFPVFDTRGCRTPEYRDWQAYSAALFVSESPADDGAGARRPRTWKRRTGLRPQLLWRHLARRSGGCPRLAPTMARSALIPLFRSNNRPS